MYMWVTFRITQENMSDAPPLSGRALTLDAQQSYSNLNMIKTLTSYNPTLTIYLTSYVQQSYSNLNMIKTLTSNNPTLTIYLTLDVQQSYSNLNMIKTLTSYNPTLTIYSHLSNNHTPLNTSIG